MLNTFMYKKIINSCKVNLLLKIFMNIRMLVVNVLNLHRIDLARKYYTHLQREIENEEEGEKE
jgi:hypothetical protein